MAAAQTTIVDLMAQMFHQVDDQSETAEVSDGLRASELSLLAHASLEMLELGLADWQLPTYSWLRQPETGLMMIRGRIGGDGEPFNLGEVPVTRCVLRLNAERIACVGVGYVMGRSRRHAEMVALYDALLQTSFRLSRGDAVLARITQQRAQRRDDNAARANATKVEFFTVAREVSA